jgi:dipeptidyl-peptidase-4
VHSVTAGDPKHGFVDIHSSNTRLPKATIHDPLGVVLGEIPVPLDDDFSSLQIRSAEHVTLAGSPPLFGALLKPRHMEANKRYPVIVMVYGGPGAQLVLNEYNPRLIWQHLADRGFVIWQLDNRGSAGRGHAFEAPLYRKMGSVELDDQLTGLTYLSSLSFVDMSRVGIYGHSYGGYMAALAMLKAPQAFKVGVAGSPVTDWKFYDTGYTERFMGTPANNPAGYGGASLLPLADKLEGKLMLVHALMDENVHFEHTAAFIDALVAADRDFDLLVFPGERHGYRSPKARQYAYRRVAEYFARNL